MEPDNIRNNTIILDLLERIEYLSKNIYEYYYQYMDIACQNNLSELSDKDLKIRYNELQIVNKSLTKIYNQYLVNSKYVDFETWLTDFDIGD